MKKGSVLTVLMFVGITFLSCSAGDNFAMEDMTSNSDFKKEAFEQAAKDEAYAEESEALEEGNAGSPEMEDPIMLIRSGNVSFDTEDMAKTVSRLRFLNRHFNNTVFSENQYENPYSRTASFSVGINPKKFDVFMDSLDQVAVIYTNKTISGEDVTDEVIDVRSRIKTKKAVLERYMELLNNARGIDEILRLEREVGAIQEEIESTEARYNSLMHRVNLSKLEISIYQELKPMEEDTFKEDASDAVKGGTEGIKTVIVGALYIWPFWIISLIAIVWLLIKRKQWKANRAKK